MDAKCLLKKYLGNTPELYNLVLDHSLLVVEKALQTARLHPELNLDTVFLTEAGLLHDIGVFQTNAPTIYCHGAYPYICHGYLGKEILESEGLPRHALVCERHTGTGLTLKQILSESLPLPHRDMVPQTLEEQVLCFSDKFYSKSKPGKEFSVREVCLGLEKYGKEGVERFVNWTTLFL
jgi:uncharacterized protein